MALREAGQIVVSRGPAPAALQGVDTETVGEVLGEYERLAATEPITAVKLWQELPDDPTELTERVLRAGVSLSPVVPADGEGEPYLQLTIGVLAGEAAADIDLRDLTALTHRAWAGGVLVRVGGVTADADPLLGGVATEVQQVVGEDAAGLLALLAWATDSPYSFTQEQVTALTRLSFVTESDQELEWRAAELLAPVLGPLAEAGADEAMLEEVVTEAMREIVTSVVRLSTEGQDVVLTVGAAA